MTEPAHDPDGIYLAAARAHEGGHENTRPHVLRLAENRSFRAAVDAARAHVAEELLRCLDCGKPHRPRHYTNAKGYPAMSWADPDDGHAYRHMDGNQMLQWAEDIWLDTASTTQDGGQ